MSRGKYRRRREGFPARGTTKANDAAAVGKAEPDETNLAVMLAKRWGLPMLVAHLLSLAVLIGGLSAVGILLAPGWPSMILMVWGEWGPKNYIDPRLSTAQVVVEAWPLLNIACLAWLFCRVKDIRWWGALIVAVIVTTCSWGVYKLGVWTSDGSLSDVVNRWHPTSPAVHVAKVVDRRDEWQKTYARRSMRVTGGYPVYTVALASWRKPGEIITMTVRGVQHSPGMRLVKQGDQVLVDEHAGLLGRAWVANVRICEPSTCP